MAIDATGSSTILTLSTAKALTATVNEDDKYRRHYNPNSGFDVATTKYNDGIE